VPYEVENAMYEWREGERVVRDADDSRRRALERAADAVVEELRRRLGSTFTLAELADLYGRGVDWASEAAQERFVGADVHAAVDSAFARYSREAADWAGGRQRDPFEAL
jgi:hypothetical protein